MHGGVNAAPGPRMEDQSFSCSGNVPPAVCSACAWPHSAVLSLASVTPLTLTETTPVPAGAVFLFHCVQVSGHSGVFSTCVFPLGEPPGSASSAGSNLCLCFARSRISSLAHWMYARMFIE